MAARIGCKIRFKTIKKIKCPSCGFKKNKGINYILGFIQVMCKQCRYHFQYDEIFKKVVPFNHLIDLYTGNIVKDPRK